MNRIRMKLLKFLPAAVLFSCFGAAAESRAQLTINYDFTPNATVPDGNGQYADARVLGGLSGLSNFSNVVTRLNLTSGNTADPMYLGDMYSSLTLGTANETQRIAVLLNRPGRDNNNAFGSSLSSLNVTLDDTVTNGRTNVFSATGDGTYYADGRLNANPYGAGVAFASGSNGLAALNGAPLASNRVSLLVADTSQGGTATLAGWGVSVTGTAATSGTFTPFVVGATTSISDTNSASANNIGATLDTTGGVVTFNLAGTTTLAGGVTGSGGINKTGAGTLILASAGSYTGGTAVNGGTLLVNGGTAGSTSGTGSGNVTVNNSGTLLGGTGAISGSVNVTGAGTIAPGATGAAGSIGTLSTGALTLSSTSTLAFDIISAASKDSLALGGNTLTLGGSTLALNLGGGFNYGQTYAIATGVGGVSGNFGNVTGYDNVDYLAVFSFSGGEYDLRFSSVPEPATILGGMMMLGVLGYHQRRRIGSWFRARA